MSEIDETQRGWASVSSRDWRAAEEHFRRVLEANPFDADALTGMAALYLHVGDADQARELCEMAVAQAERDLPRARRHTTGWDDAKVRPYLRALFYLSLAYVHEEAWALAQPALEEIVAWDVTGMGGEALNLLAQVLHRIDRLDDAAHAYVEAAEYIPEAYYSAGLAYWRLGKRREAERMWRRGLERRPQLAALIVHYPRVLPNPRGGLQDPEFNRAVEYLEYLGELWDEESKSELAHLYERRVALNG
ncbi:MAG: tetratricopeptide repeat protein [Firmicutes bacterium]|nr:tetratricopeptide repeat protein [Bacillota bacterium]